MAKELLTLDNGTTCTSWNYSGTRLAAGSADGTLSIFDSREPPSSSSLRSTFKSRVLEGNIVKIVWIPPEYGDAVACISADGIVSLWEEVAEDSQSLQWKMCKSFGNSSSKVLDVQFGISLASLKMVAAYSDGNVRVFELSDPLELRNWQLQAEFQNVIESVSSFGKASCLSASISWNPQKGGSQESSFLVGFNSNTPELNSSKFGNLIRLIKDGFLWQNWHCLRTRVIRFMLLHGHQILADHMRSLRLQPTRDLQYGILD
uniref:Anaphase-promoting complex subunit 4 WD40 domain-containing protein n=1 Tax=Glycine max TaxID=3847 RepID=C6T7M6_SOYBN|nr:unknown [Glycine max]